MPEPPATQSSRRHPWPRTLVRLRRVWFGVVEVVSFFAAGAMAVGCVLVGRWPEARRPTERAVTHTSEVNPRGAP